MKGSTNGDGTVVCLCTTAPIDNINALLIADLVHRDRAKSASLFRNINSLTFPSTVTAWPSLDCVLERMADSVRFAAEARTGVRASATAHSEPASLDDVFMTCSLPSKSDTTQRIHDLAPTGPRTTDVAVDTEPSRSSPQSERFARLPISGLSEANQSGDREAPQSL